jgi:murein DD-endopeptidase MepM/ murein hydrolase activator NlpD
MRRLVPLALALALALAGIAGSARADTFQIVQTEPIAIPAPTTGEQVSPEQLLGLWQQAGASYGIPWQVLAAINKVESNFGRNMGPSSAGAIGWMQFMPQTWLKWGMDANGDGVADPWNAADAIYSAARYLAAAGGAAQLPRAVFAYNHADWYVSEVLSLADLYGAGGATATLSLDKLQQQLDTERQTVAAAGARLQTLAAAAARWRSKVTRAALLSDRLALDRHATLTAIARDRAAAALARAQSALRHTERQAAAASFAPAASSLLAGPSYSSGYVFPVGGGAAAVSASHTHHDYPAVDIAAPLGSPVYALADADVLSAWAIPGPNCGIGFTLRASDGQVWTYCHLAELDPAVLSGDRLHAGQQVGLVGETGDATGPHLHLQLQPATAWPQQEAWFTSFAGVAFHWADDPAQPEQVRTLAVVSAPPAAAAPVFSVVPAPSGSGVVLFDRPGG